MLIVDAQIHAYTGRPEPENVGPQPPGTHQANFPIERVLLEMDATGVDRAVLVPPTLMMSNALEYSQNAAASHPDRFGLMPHFNPEAADAREQLARVPTQPHWLGIRMHLSPHLAWIEDEQFQWLWSDCERLQIPVTCLISGMPGKLQPVAARHPDLTLIVDHMGRVPDVQGAAAFGALDQLLPLAQYPRVAVKMTSVPDSSAEPYPFGDLYAGIKTIFETFGPQRMLWGSDLSGLSCPYRECLDHFRTGLDFLSETDKEWILGKAAATVLNWGE
jgi:predicted TIM-barrel fold metal-dependent hydrolase